MTILNTLTTFKPSRKGVFDDPISHRRNLFIGNLKKQILMIDDDEGEEIKGRRWLRKSGDGYSSCLRYSTDIVEFKDGITHFSVESGERLKEVYETIIKEVGDGGFDEMLEKHWDLSSFNKEDKVS